MQIDRQKRLPLALACVLLCVSNAAGNDGPSAAGVSYFEKHVRPLLIERCYECHGERAEGGLRIDSRDGLLAGGEHGPTIKPGDVDGSLLIQAVRYGNSDYQMPPDGKLPADTIAKLERWVKMGAPDPRVDKPSATPQHPNPSDPIAGKKHWAFQPLSTDSAPIVGAAHWPRSTIDSYVMAQLEAANLTPAPIADRRTLARRLYLVLTGLPPTHQQIESFMRDRDTNAYQRLVNELIASPHFGQRWGRHWLDLARYADSNGLDENFLFREAWRYRNWVIDAVNADMPFDRFVLEQIAGDLLPYESIDRRDRQRIAAGFLVVGPKVLLGNVEQNQRMEVADEQLDTIGRAILGQTLGCARCHDHKFDPVPTADYYAMAGILTSTKVVEQRYMLGQQRVMERLVGLGSEGDALDEAYEKYWRDLPGVKTKRDRAKKALELLEKDEIDAFKKHLDQHTDCVAKVAADSEQSKETRLEAQKAFLAELEKVVASPRAIPSRAMIPADVQQPADEQIRIAGQFDRKGDQVPRGVLSVLSDREFKIPGDTSGRVELAGWLTERQGAGQLAARVLANRVWRHLIGRGLVRTVDNFGRTGEAPTHPKLLDHLATRLIESNWSVKELVRAIVMSKTFTMSSRHDDDGYAADPDNALLWRAHRRRLAPESLRDAMLIAAGKLDLRPMESSVWYLGDQATAVGGNANRRRTDFPCRSVYLPVVRNDLPELFEVFDFADPHVATGMRPQTTVAMQGLYLLNAESVMDAAQAIAQRVLSSGENANAEVHVVDKMFTLILGVLPTSDERSELVRFLHDAENRFLADGDQEAELRAISLACQALLASSRFQMME